MNEPITFRDIFHDGSLRLTVIETGAYARRLPELRTAMEELVSRGVTAEWWITPLITDTGWIRLRATLEEQL